MEVLSSSYRDPAGFLFRDAGVLKRAVTAHGREDYQALMASGLYDKLAGRGLLIPHREEPGGEFFKVLAPEELPLISYPYEWCFSQLQDAALLTLRLQLLAMEHGMSLKDASPFNVQFDGCRPVFIDTLSFERLRPIPWVAYRQFCEMFLAALYCMAAVRADFNRYLRVDINGLDLAACSRTLPLSSWLRPGALIHIHLHAISQARFNRRPPGRRAPAGGAAAGPPVFSRRKLEALIHHLLSSVSALKPPKRRTAFSDYYRDCGHYTARAAAFKEEFVASCLDEIRPRLVLDAGANDGKYSRLATARGMRCVSIDADAACVEENYRSSRERGDAAMLPLLVDIANPSSDAGWACRERPGFLKRVRPDMVLALAIFHHLRIGANLPLAMQAAFFAGTAPFLVAEFVPVEDPMARELLRNRAPGFEDYTVEGFEETFGREFRVRRKAVLPESFRILYLLERRGS